MSAAIAGRSLEWYEGFAAGMHLGPLAFAMDTMTRDRHVDIERIGERAPGIAARFEA